MLVEPNRTAYDLNFRLFGTPIRVHPLFWLGAALLGADFLNIGLVYLLVWIAAVFVSILVHEFGHALAFRWFGTGSQIVLYVFGGLAIPWNGVAGKWRRIMISLAGPAAGFILCGLVWGSNQAFVWAPDPPEGSLSVWLFYRIMIFINLYWGIFNLLPVFPLDGGQVCKEVCAGIWPRNGVRIALEISVAVAGAVALYSLACEFERKQGGGWFNALPGWFPRGSYWTAILFGMLAVQNFQLLQYQTWMESHWDQGDDRPPWKQ